MARFVPDPEGINQLQQHVNGKAQAVIRQVNDDKAGRPADEVLAALMSGMRAAGVEPNEVNLRRAAESISDGTCT